MVVTRHRAGAHSRPGYRHETPRASEAKLLALGLGLTLLGLLLAYRGAGPELRSAQGLIESGEWIVLGPETPAEALLPLLGFLSDPEERSFFAAKITGSLEDDGQSGPPNVGELARLRVSRGELAGLRLPTLERRFDRRSRRLGRAADSVALLDSSQLRALKQRLLVRTPAQFRRTLATWTLASLLALLGVHAVWRGRRFAGDELLLPGITVLCGLGLCVMVSVRDPLRDLLLFRPFAQGVIAGCVLLVAASFIDIEHSPLRRVRFAALLGALGLSVLLILFGEGPGSSDAKVNLFGFQPVEAVKVLVVLFLAGYFFERWELLRELNERRPELPGPLARLRLPKLDYVLPPITAMGLVLAFFFLQRDLGPALVMSFLFLCLYYVARGRALMVGVGIALLAVGFSVGYELRLPATVAGRIDMWLKPWDNAFRGGEHLAHSLWALSTGALTGRGLGRGEAFYVPEVHTDMVLSAVGEELGLLGLLSVLAIFAVLIQRGFRAALRSGDAYAFFLGLGLTLVLALQILLIAGGVLGFLPLSGVVTPFLSYGRSAMLANFAIVGLLAAISAHPGYTQHVSLFRPAALRIGGVLAALLLGLVVKAVWVQAVRADGYLVRGTRALQADGQRRYVYNPRLLEIARSVRRGAVVDRNGVVLATSDPDELEQHRATYESLGLVAAPDDGDVDRHYPLGGRAFHLLGDAETRTNWAASNTSFVERDMAVRLQGYDDRPRGDGSGGGAKARSQRDYSELIPLVRKPSSSRSVREFLERDRTVRLTLDARLQVKVGDILARHIRAAGQRRGAAVVLDAESGDLLASVSIPWPQEAGVAPGGEGFDERLLDRARYGVYPPGSTFKLVTAMAALRKSPSLSSETYPCIRLTGGRVGHQVRGWKQPIRDDPSNTRPHGRPDLFRALVYSCNAYFAQLATYGVGPSTLLETAAQMGIEVAQPNTTEKARDLLPQAGYGQGQVLATPFEMARVAATLAQGGKMPQGRWILGEDNPRSEPPRQLLAPELADRLAAAMRQVVTEGSASRVLAAVRPPIAGKTGTAEVAGKPSHSWFVGYAPFGRGERKIAFSVLVEHGGYGGRAAAAAAGEIVREAAALGLLR